MELVILHMGRRERSRAYRENISCPACRSHHVVKYGKNPAENKECSAESGKYFMLNALYHHSKALKMYSNSMRAISKALNIL